MSRLLVIATVVVLLACASVSNANIIAAQAHNDDDGAIICDYGHTGSGWSIDTQTMSIFGDQYGGRGHVGTHISTSGPTTLNDNAYFTTDSDSDPTVKISNGIVNDSGYAWTTYHVNVFMANTFSLSNAMVTSPGDWAAPTITPTAWDSVSELYKGQIDYSVGTSGTPVAVDDELDFSYRMTFNGSTHYAYTQETIPGPTPLPEPGTWAILAAGLFGLVIVQRRFGRYAGRPRI